VFRWGIHRKFFVDDKSMLYYPLNAIEDLAPLPFYKYISTFTPVKDFNIVLNYEQATLISIISVVAFITISYYLLKKRDL
jgi:hypothetical protein